MTLLDNATATGLPPSLIELGALMLLRYWPCLASPKQTRGSGWSPTLDGERCMGCSACEGEAFDETEIGESGA